MSNSLRITGMATGMDTDATIKQMMKPYTMKVDKMKQDKQIVAWKQELYRDILADIDTMKKTFFDVLKSDTYMLSKNNYAGFDVKATNTVATESAGVSATTSVGAVAGSYLVNVERLATADKISGTAINVVGVNKYDTKLSELGITNGGKLNFEYKDANGVVKTSEITVLETDTISQLMEAVNKGTSGAVKLNFSELTKSFSIESLQTGELASLTVTESGGKNVLTNLGLSGAMIEGKDAIVTITPPGAGAITITKPGNTFSIDGVNYTLTKEGTINEVTIAGNSQKTFDKIKVFIDKYNELIEKVSAKTGEKKQYKYLPLSEEQKADMEEDEIKQWDIKAKQGLLKGDSNLDSMLSSMRSAFYEEVEGAGISLSEIGMSTSAVTSKRGKIILDETKLKAAIETRGEQVANLFSRTSTTYSSYNPDYTSTERTKRSKEEGIFQKINDILEDYTRTSRNISGKKGILLEKAGLKGDLTEFKSILSEDIIKKDEKINEMIKSLAAKENKFYAQFAKLEVAMNKLNSQSSWLTQQLSGGQ